MLESLKTLNKNWERRQYERVSMVNCVICMWYVCSDWPPFFEVGSFPLKGTNGCGHDLYCCKNNIFFQTILCGITGEYWIISMR